MDKSPFTRVMLINTRDPCKKPCLQFPHFEYRRKVINPPTLPVREKPAGYSGPDVRVRSSSIACATSRETRVLTSARSVMPVMYRIRRVRPR